MCNYLVDNKVMAVTLEDDNIVVVGDDDDINNSALGAAKKSSIKKRRRASGLWGLALANKTTRLEVARKGGLSPHRSRGLSAIKDPAIRKRIASIGGNSVKQKYGTDYYSQNGRKGASAVHSKYGKKFYGENGKKGAAVRGELKKGKKGKKWKSGEEPNNNNNNSSVGSSVV
jgi:hypothetical protein